MDGGTFGQMAYLMILLVAVGGWVVVEYRGRMGSALRTAAAWGLIFIGVMAGYGLWTDMRSDIRREAVMVGDSMQVPRAQDGHYYLTLNVSGQPVDFMVDTGATNVVLSRADASRVGIDPSSLAYIGEAQTANGSVRTARVKIENVTLGPWNDPTLAAWVSDGAMDGSLLGMDYLGKFRIEIADDKMILRR
ncbi:MAG: TIGR02281 family clan AA aspartic protease [Cereibacter sphaeroides]|uniref:TIGR02281 family clan AA aspartic protease n=1 Tax=Cereibacter sphaeroides TaxID=1063 RepID=A0A2W5SIP2_CERSP|nr:MAG: TIGR02281 family clan AA aspartic protease [Cereibacter sphaeroides]